MIQIEAAQEILVRLAPAGMLRGECAQTGVYRPWMPVDVRDDAACHIGLLESAAVQNGERYIAWSAEAVPVEQVNNGIGRLLPELRHAPGPVVDGQPERIRAREADMRAIATVIRELVTQ